MSLIIRLYYIVFILITLAIKMDAQKQFKIEHLKSNFVKSENKQKYYTNLVKNVNLTFTNELENPKDWIKALRNAQSIFLKNTYVENGIISALKLSVDSNIKLQQVALEVAYTLYPNKYSELINKILLSTKDELSFGIALKYLNRIKENSGYFLKLTHQKFFNYQSSSFLKLLIKDLTNNQDGLPDSNIITDLLNHNFQDGQTIIYSFHRKNRKIPGLTIIKKPNGSFVKNNDGTIFSIPQLALSYSNLPGYFPNGNTPQGLYSIIGWYISPTETIGPTPNVLVRTPFEVNPDIFFHKNNMNWKSQNYENLLPKSLKSFTPLWESFYAGKIGRRLIIMHGSTDETSYFKSEPYYPLTPTRGCLSAEEIWDEETGKCIESDQLNLINAYLKSGSKTGFLVVLEINDKNEPMCIEEILQYIK